MNVQIFSLPSQFVIPHQDWLKTPDVDARVNQVARTYFANWSLGRLELANNLLLFVGVFSFVSVSIACYKRHLLSFVISGLTFVLCLIGSDAVRRELRVRLEKTCLTIEDWLISLKKTAEKLDFILTASFKDKTPPYPSIPLATYQSLCDLAQQVSEGLNQQLDQFADQLNSQHLLLFGQVRQIDQAKLSNDWIWHFFKAGLARPLGHFYVSMKMFQQSFVRFQQDPQNSHCQKDIYMAAHTAYQNCCQSAEKISMADLLEKHQQSIAAFRSSLHL